MGRRWVISGEVATAVLYITCMFTYDVTTNIGKVRLLVADTDATKPIFQDDEVQASLDLEQLSVFIPITGNIPTPLFNNQPSVRRAAATLLDVLAANKARLAGALKVLDIQIDTSKAAAELRATAKALRDTEANMGHFGVIEMVQGQFSARERWAKEMLRRA